MHCNQYLALLGLSVPFVAAVGKSADTKFACATRYGTKSLAIVPSITDTYTFSSTITRRIGVVPTVTVTPADVTSTLTTVSTSVAVVETQTTDEYTTTKFATLFNTETKVETYSATSTSYTSVTVSSTTTVATPAGFTALANIPGFAPKNKRSDTIEERDASADTYLGPRRPAKQADFGVAPVLGGENFRSAIVSPPQFPKRVVCDKQITSYVTQIVTLTATNTLTNTAAAQTMLATITQSTTVTSTSTLADATTVITVPVTRSTTLTSTSSTTTTSVGTVVVELPSATYLAQCANDNIVSSAQGLKIGFIRYNQAFTLQSQYTSDTVNGYTGPSGYGCCATCAATPNCAGYGYNPSGSCFYIVTDGRCTATQSFGDEYHYYNLDGDGYRVGNGQCGFLKGVAGVK